jgi:histidine triad (HIT) family protein
MSDCVFCDIIAGEAPATIVYADERAVAFHDRVPRAPVHILIVPIEHIDSVNDLKPEHESLAGHLLLVAQKIAEQEGIARSGYRLIVNTGRSAGQVVYHLHVHVLGGGPMSAASAHAAAPIGVALRGPIR